MPSERLLPIRLELDLADQDCTPEMARMIKNLSYFRTDTSQVTEGKSGASGVYKPLIANQIYYEDFSFPEGYNHYAGGFVAKDSNCVLFFNYNSNENHALYRINGNTQTIDTIYLKSCLNLQLKPEHFMHVGSGWLELFDFTDPDTGNPRRRSYFMFTDGYGDMRFICLEDSLTTNSFDTGTFPYFVNPEDPCLLINAGVPTPMCCVRVAEVPNDDITKPNFLKFKTWQFRVRYIDVYGRPSEYGIISDIYIPGINDCVNSSDFLARCLDLTFCAGGPLINAIEVAFRNCNDQEWQLDTTLFLYKGSSLGDWWLRARNPSVTYNQETNEITYRFCKDKECNPISPDLTNRTQNPIPRTLQSVAKIGDVIGVANDKSGFNPINIDDVSVVVEKPTTVSDPDVTRNIELFVPVINPFLGNLQPVYKDDEGRWVWGGRYKFTNQYEATIYSGYKQYFGDVDRNGFVGYLAGTGEPPNSTVSELYYLNDANELVKVEDFSIIFTPPFGKIWYLRFAFTSVPPAKYTFRIADPKVPLTDKHFQNTSTYVAGSFSWINKLVNIGNKVDPAKELLIDVCDEDYSSLNDLKVLAIYDLSHPGAQNSDKSKVASGYIYARLNSNAEAEEPIELLGVRANKHNEPADIISEFTDHNGFYYAADGMQNYFVEIFGFCGCNNYKKLASKEVGDDPQVYEEDFVIDNRLECPDYGDQICNKITISGKVTLCDSEIGVPGVGVVLSRGAYAITGADGTFKIIAHDNNYQNPFQRNDNLFYVPTICKFRACDTDCVLPYQITINKCEDCIERTFPEANRQIRFDVRRGPLSGGRYGVSIWGAHDWLGRHTFSQVKDDMYVTIPTLVETQLFAPSTIKIIIPPSVTFPSYFKNLTIGITKELSLQDYITWIIDKVEFIDNTGNINDISPTQIRLYYASLNEYNSQNNFNTTTGWQFLDTAKDPAINFTNDYVEFYMNGDGVFFPQVIRALVKYDQKGQYFLIDYDTALKDLKQYALVRLGRPNECATPGLFFEQCIVVEIKNGKAQQNEIILNFFDTYYNYRQIPIPIGTSDYPENVLKNFGFAFEHHSPSDFWGDHCINIGRVNARNPYETEILRENEVMLSGALSDNGLLNFFNFFDDALKKNFKGDFGGIVAMLPQTGMVGFICQANVFKAGFNDNLIRVVNGQISLPSENSLFGNPDTTVGYEYGCKLFDKNTIQIKEGLIEFLDTKTAALIQYDYSELKIVSRLDLGRRVIGGVDSYLRSRIKYIERWNKDNPESKIFWHSGIDPAAREYLLTNSKIGAKDYVNEARDFVIEKNDTLRFDFKNGFFRGFLSATPNGWTFLESNILDLQLFSVTDQNVYYHYSTGVKTYNTFYGVEVEKVLRFVSVLDKFKKKQPTFIEVYCAQSKYFSPLVKTDSNQESRILLDYFKQGLYLSAAPFLCDLNTPDDPNLPALNKLTDGNKLFGSIIDITMVGDPSKNTEYSELLGFIIELLAQEKSG